MNNVVPWQMALLHCSTLCVADRDSDSVSIMLCFFLLPSGYTQNSYLVAVQSHILDYYATHYWWWDEVAA